MPLKLVKELQVSGFFLFFFFFGKNPSEEEQRLVARTDVFESVLHPLKSLYFLLYNIRSKFYCTIFSSSLKNELITSHHFQGHAGWLLFSHCSVLYLNSCCPSRAGTTLVHFLFVSGNRSNFKYCLFQGQTALCLGTGSSLGLLQFTGEVWLQSSLH